MAMASGCTDRLRGIAAWPIDTIHEAAGGAVRGFVMRRVARQKDIHILYGPKTRLRDYPDATYRFLVHVAANLARAFAVVHDHGHVIGDVNQGGVCVSAQGMITLVDCDSFQVRASQRVFSCDVGIPIYQPPELQSVRSFQGLPRTPNHDNFGLAVLIFQTLFLARHPFAGAFQGDGDMPIERAIRELRFAYGRDAARRQMKQPPGTLGLGAVPTAVAELFERAFLESGTQGQRPTAMNWITALDGFSSELQECSQNPGHAHTRTLTSCPLCEIEGRVGILLFLPPQPTGGPSPTIDIEALWRELVPIIAGARVPAVSAAQASVPVLAPPDAIVRFQHAKSRASRVLWFGIAASVLMAMLWHPAALVGAIVAPIIALKMHGYTPDEARDVHARLTAAKDRYRTIARQLEHERSTSSLPGLEARAESTYRGLRAFEQRRIERFRDLERGRHEQQLRRYLDQFEVKDSRLKGFGPGRFAALVSNGVETADDLTVEKLTGIAGFGPKRIAALLDWRRKLEASFKFNPSDPAGAQERARVERELQIDHAREVTELQRLAEQIKAQAGSLRQRIVALTDELGQARQELALIHATAETLGMTT
jgi:DNA-binding helix-hairpin-helix protein with protein kinase domain